MSFQLQSAIVPPSHVLEVAYAAAETLRLPLEQPPPPESRGGLLGRISRGSTKQAPQVEAPPSFDIVPAEHRFIRLTRFGNVGHEDTETLGLALGVAAWDWPAPVVHIASLDIDRTLPVPVITAKLGGEIDSLREIFRKILEVAQSQRFFLDRRIFHPEFPVAVVQMPDDEALRERLELETETFVGLEWQITHFSLLSLSFGATARTFEEIAVVPLGAAG